MRSPGGRLPLGPALVGIAIGGPLALLGAILISPVFGASLLPDPRFHEVMIGAAVLMAGALGAVALRTYQRTGATRAAGLAAGLLGFAAIYLWHGLFTTHAPSLKFLLYGPVSRLVFAAALLSLLARPGTAPGLLRRRNLTLIVAGVVALGLAAGLLGSLVGEMAARLSATEFQRLRFGLETAAFLLTGALTFRLYQEARAAGALGAYVLPAGVGLTAVQSLYFLAGSAWSAVWWLAHGIGAVGTFVIAWAVLYAWREAEREFQREKELASLRQVSEYRAHIMNTAAHELNTPLTPISLQLHLLKDEKTGALNERQRKALAVLERNVDQLRFLVKDMADAAHLETGHMELWRTRVDLNRVVLETTESFQEAARAKAIALEARLTPALETEADAKRISQVVSNLLTNALKFTPPGGLVTVATHQEGGHLVVTVTDTGEGISRDNLPRLFLPFSQIRAPGAPKGVGTGLGLYICKGIVEAHGGTIQAESAGPGKGTAFTFKLPTTAAPPAETPLPAPSPRAQV
ncbi:MAG TPA: HAMP domain-containing sensor histidine kinase [Candidatus Thermoplasmatota archaeon]|nr:HAMP domain-containing sensor histidine kinase [Candidatus Thermoplasmatota archaeon]